MHHHRLDLPQLTDAKLRLDGHSILIVDEATPNVGDCYEVSGRCLGPALQTGPYIADDCGTDRRVSCEALKQGCGVVIGKRIKDGAV